MGKLPKWWRGGHVLRPSTLWAPRWGLRVPRGEALAGTSVRAAARPDTGGQCSFLLAFPPCFCVLEIEAPVRKGVPSPQRSVVCDRVYTRLCWALAVAPGAQTQREMCL